jgi:hypothetical protein
LIIELLLFSKFLCEKKKSRIEKIKNPVFYEEGSRKENFASNHTYQIASSKLKNNEKKSSQIEYSENDRVLPPKSVFKCEVLKKGGSLISADKHLFLFVGMTQIILSR